MFLNPIKYKITNNFLVYSSSAVKSLTINCSFFLTLQYSFFLSIISTKARHNTMHRQKVSIFCITLRSAYLLNKHCSIYNRQTSTNKQVWVQRLRHYHLYHLKKGTCTGLKRGRFFLCYCYPSKKLSLQTTCSITMHMLLLIQLSSFLSTKK